MIFGRQFNQPITLPEGLTHLKFGSHFNQPINIPEGLSHLIFGLNFNQQVNIPNSLTHLYIFDIQKDIKVKYNNKIIKMKELPINFVCYDNINHYL